MGGENAKSKWAYIFRIADSALGRRRAWRRCRRWLQRNPGNSEVRKAPGGRRERLAGCLFRRTLFLENLQNCTRVRAKELLEILRRFGRQQDAIGFEPAPLRGGPA